MRSETLRQLVVPLNGKVPVGVSDDDAVDLVLITIGPEGFTLLDNDVVLLFLLVVVVPREVIFAEKLDILCGYQAFHHNGIRHSAPLRLSV